MTGAKVTARASAVLVALIAGFASFRHIVDVAREHGEDLAVAYALPFSIDGLMLVATAAMIEDKRAGRHPRTSARVAFAFGVAASLAANLASARPTAGGRLVAVVAPIALLLAVEVLSRSGRPRTDAEEGGTTVPPSAEGGTTVPPAPEAPEPVPAPSSDADDVRAEVDEPAVPEVEQVEQPDDEPAPEVPEVEEVGPADRQAEHGDPLILAARTVAGEMAAAGRRVTRDALAAELRARGHRVATTRAGRLARELAAAA
ncbi:DUF2637 domain-containing protein [Phytohabitans sp. ZYX-F-186]|uniref:DUF2637 domain-containing protein n=1 Tax=Phytohabitans maris TaxID=3071409 RepID=A0ABU0ZUQ0_9ACTN|nr:DUF2637 domain-containing protein [Phytohabitans sp. ZYX-F-186]MDQ7910769.1 DUF2637 domain-containing protein [Phytohabitans sp. ZYX-F-186]